MPRVSRAVLLFAALVASGVPVALGDESNGVARSTLPAVLERLDRAQHEMERFRARFVETRRLALLSEPEVLKGTLWFEEPGKLRWEYREPVESVYVLADGELTGWIPSEKRFERMKLGGREKRIRRLVALGRDARELTREFDVQLVRPPAIEGTDELLLVPNSRRVRRRVAEIRLALDARGLPRAIRYRTADGDEVEVVLSDLELDPEASSDLFRLDVPAGAQVREGVSSLGWGPGRDDDDGSGRGVRRP